MTQESNGSFDDALKKAHDEALQELARAAELLRNTVHDNLYHWVGFEHVQRAMDEIGSGRFPGLEDATMNLITARGNAHPWIMVGVLVDFDETWTSAAEIVRNTAAEIVTGRDVSYRRTAFQAAEDPALRNGMVLFLRELSRIGMPVTVNL
ncbi:hypothetical protein [Actinomadura miaoliensis]|uniref:Uncharacterized protein n=1 Tax=Actinomadura miaoliensis TaxID=430685 RepID=A0ABP7WD18_9ACTN